MREDCYDGNATINRDEYYQELREYSAHLFKKLFYREVRLDFSTT